ncbi:MAG: CopG family transcriptional regulator [Candidatus Sumerlaeia bacterium]|nr:CopG family transcriptional regulator [Candidatus Sumerlaeia bacterium]
MAMAKVALTEQEQKALEAVARQLGRTPEELVHDAVKQLIAQHQREDRLALLRQARGMWKDRSDIPSFSDLRREWDRQMEDAHGSPAR